MHHASSPDPDICISGAGIIGLSLALELHRRGHRVIVFDRNDPLAEASTAAAGMLAAADPDNPPQLRPLADRSLSLYPDFLDHIQTLSGVRVPFQTHTTLQSLPSHHANSTTQLTREQLAHLLPALIPGDRRFILLDEHSVDPRQLAPALLSAIRAADIDLRTHTPILSTRSTGNAVEISTQSGIFHAAKFVNCAGAWASVGNQLSNIPVTPRKGQMFSVALPSSLPLQSVIRTHDVYIVPRTIGPTAGRAIIGATVEDIGFDKTLHPFALQYLRSLAVALLPALADAPQLEAWSGLRPATHDGLPLLGHLPDQPNHYIATGHYRNGILLAPATARLMAQILSNEAPSLDIAAFSPSRPLLQTTAL